MISGSLNGVKLLWGCDSSRGQLRSARPPRTVWTQLVTREFTPTSRKNTEPRIQIPAPHKPLSIRTSCTPDSVYPDAERKGLPRAETKGFGRPSRATPLRSAARRVRLGSGMCLEFANATVKATAILSVHPNRKCPKAPLCEVQQVGSSHP